MLMDFSNGYQHIGIPTNDMNATADFYHKLGFKTIMETVNDGSQVKFFEYGSIQIETYECGGNAAGKPGGIDHIAIDCPDITGLIKAAKSEGYEFCEGPSFLPFWDHGFMYAKIKGPNAEVFEFGRVFSSDEERDKAIAEVM